MQTSANGLQFIAKWEGTVLHTYTDAGGRATIGVGHLLTAGESYPDGITEQQALDLLAQDVHTAEDAVNAGVKVTVSQNMFDAMVSLTFNIGTGGFASSTVLRDLNAGNVPAAAKAFEMWDKVNGQPNAGLLNRRKAEESLFLTPGTLTGNPALPTVVAPSPAPAVTTQSPVTLPTVPGESAADRLIRIIRSYVGCSLLVRRADLGALVARGVDNPESVVTIATNCGTTALGFMALAGVQHPLLLKPYVSGMAISWLRTIGTDLGALQTYSASNPPPPGALVRYNIAGTNDDHVEWIMGPISAAGVCDHAGGGRANNAITEGVGPVLSSWGRPLVEWWDPAKLGIEVLPAVVAPADPVAATVSAAIVAAQPQANSQPTLSSPTVTPAGLKAIWNFIVQIVKMFLKLKGGG